MTHISKCTFNLLLVWEDLQYCFHKLLTITVACCMLSQNMSCAMQLHMSHTDRAPLRFLQRNFTSQLIRFLLKVWYPEFTESIAAETFVTQNSELSHVQLHNSAAHLNRWFTVIPVLSCAPLLNNAKQIELSSTLWLQ